MAAAASGQALDSNTIDKTSGSSPSETPDSSVTIDEGNEFVTGAESTNEDLLPGGDDTPSDLLGKKGPASPKGKPEVSAKEFITVTDDQGRRRKVEIDYSNRESIKKAFELQAGARKWQAERDHARTELAKQSKSLSDMQNNWNTMETAFQKGGIEGVIDLLEGRQGAYKNWEKKAIDRARFLDHASPEEIQALEAREQNQRTQKEVERLRKESQDFQKKMEQEREAAQLHSLESRVHPVFDKYRFADKLGSPTDEHMFDEMLWNTALKRLEPFEEKGLEITNEMVEREFRAVAQSLRKRIGVQAEKQATRAVEQKKREATENVQSKITSGYRQQSGAGKEARDLIENRNLTGLLKNWGKYGGLFNKK